MVSRTDERTSLEEPGLREAWRTSRSPDTTEEVPNSPHQALRSREGDHTASFWWVLLVERRPRRSAIPILRITAVERTSWRTEMSKVQTTSPGEMSGVESGATGNLWEDVPVPQGTYMYQGGSRWYHRFPAADWPASGQRQCIAGGATPQQQQQESYNEQTQLM